MLRLVQLIDGTTRAVARVDEPRLRLLTGFTSAYALAQAAITHAVSLSALVDRHATGDTLDYDAIHAGTARWKLLAPWDHPDEPARCLVSGTGLTHLGSAKNRQAMHAADAHETDSMRMFRWGVEGGKPAEGKIGTPPEWFYKGTGTILRAPNDPLDVPPFADDGGEEAEIAGCYLISPQGEPVRVGMAVGNEFSDHRFEKKNYLNLAGSKIRTCALGPELVIDPAFHTIPGEVRILHGGGVIWSRQIATGEDEMCHSLRNIEHHHFKFPTHRRPGDAHIHFYGAHSLSFGDGLTLQDGDLMSVRFEGYGRSLNNPLRVFSDTPALILPRTLT